MYTWWLLSFPLRVTLTKLWNIRISVHSTTFTHPTEVLRAKYIHEASYDIHTIGGNLVSSPREDTLIEWGPTGLHSTRRETLGGCRTPQYRRKYRQITSYRKTNWQISQYRIESRWNTEIAKTWYKAQPFKRLWPLQDECASKTFFTGKKTNNTLSTLNQHGNHRFNSQWPWTPS